jgi:predicted metal-dependent hydrolase
MPSTTPPETSHRIAIAGQDVSYQLRRSKRRTIGLTIDHRGLRIGAPQRAQLGDIESLIRQHGQWVLDKLANWRERPPPAKLAVGDGTAINILGTPLQITVTPLGRARWQFVGDKLHLWPSTTRDTNQLLEKALREKSRAVFSERLQHYAPRLGVDVPPLRLSSARTRWGSCSHQGGIALNWRLIFMPLPIVDYVVAHELAHLKEMNHSPRFWAVVEQLCPEWRSRRLELRQLARQIPAL